MRRISLLAALTAPAGGRNPTKVRCLRDDISKQKQHLTAMIGLVRSGLIGSYAQVQRDTIEVFYRGRLLRFPNNGLEAGQTLCLVKPGDDDHSVPRMYGIPTNTTISPMMVALDQGLARVRQAELLLLRGQTNAAEGLLVDARRYSKLFSQERHHHEALFAH